MADTLTPEEKKRLTEELTKYANEGASDDDLRQFRDAFISELKKKGGGQPASGAPAGQPTKPSAQSTGQSAFDAWNPAFKKAEPETELKVERESKFAPKQIDGAYDTWRKSITKEAKDYVDVMVKSGNLETAIQTAMNTSNGMKPDTRTAVLVELAKKLGDMANEAKTRTKKNHQ